MRLYPPEENTNSEHYRIVVCGENDLPEITSKIDEMIKSGWTPLGGISVRVGATSGAYFLQSMYKEPEENI
jgi:hypothetical protein